MTFFRFKKCGPTTRDPIQLGALHAGPIKDNYSLVSLLCPDSGRNYRGPGIPLWQVPKILDRAVLVE